MESWVALVTVLVGALATGVLTYVNLRTRRQSEMWLLGAESLRTLRLPHYQRLFHLSGAFAGDILVRHVDWLDRPDAVAMQLRDWYFDDGAGLFLSQPARDRYFDLLQALLQAADRRPPASLVDDADRKAVCSAAEKLRSQMTRDVALDDVQRLRDDGTTAA